MAHGGGDLLRDVESVGGQVDVVGDEGHPRADDRGARGRVRRGRPVIRRPLRRFHLRSQSFEFAAPDVFEILASGVRRRVLVEIDRDPEPARDVGRRFLRQRHALLHRHAFDRDERHDVDSPEPRVLAGVLTEIDDRERRFIEGEHRLFDRLGVSRESHDRSIVRRVGGVVEDAHPVNASHRADDRVDHVVAPPFADVRYTLDDRHEIKSTLLAFTIRKVPNSLTIEDFCSIIASRHGCLTRRRPILPTPPGQATIATARPASNSSF
jgi:hypothetical protein